MLKNGATCVGKAVMDEFSFGISGENKYYGTPTNPQMPSCIPGGSSSGSAVAVAAGLVDFDIGEVEQLRLKQRIVDKKWREALSKILGIKESVFVEVEPILRSAMDGHNVCVFAYGQKGTSKTFTMIKCYMKQLLSGLEHCHSRGVMHRDIKGSNLLVNNEGILKVADFGLANFSSSSGNRQPLTSRVVTLWYRPELLLGSTDYGPSVDLWSAGCVFAELLVGKPILKGRTEVEQLHKIFKLCGSPPEEYWKKTRLPHATLFKPQQPYDSSIQETFKDFPATNVNLLQTLLSVEPNKRGTASSALSLEETNEFQNQNCTWIINFIKGRENVLC